MKKAMGKVTMVCVCLALPLIGPSRDAGAQGGAVMTYPRSGQSQDQHDRDRMEGSIVCPSLRMRPGQTPEVVVAINETAVDDNIAVLENYARVNAAERNVRI